MHPKSFKAVRVLWLVLVTTLVLIPISWCLLEADFTQFGSESVAYRLFYSLRLQAGPDPTAWLPQGQLISSLQNVIVWFMPRVTADNLHASIQIFSRATLVLISSITVIACMFAVASKTTRWQHLLTLSIAILAPTYLLPGTLMWWPDYYAMNAALAVLGVAIFQHEWSRNISSSRSELIRAVLYGVFLGSIVANKVSMIVIALPIIIAYLARPSSLRTAILRTCVIGSTALLTFAFWFSAFGYFRIGWTRIVFWKWLAFLFNPGGEAGFDLVVNFSNVYSLTLWWLLAALAAALVCCRNQRSLFTTLAGLISGLLCLLAVWKRPAGTTTAEIAILLLAIGGMMAAVSRGFINHLLLIPSALVLLFSVQQHRQIFLVRDAMLASAPISSEHWTFYERVRSLASGRPVLYFVPDNHFQYGDVFIILLKGSSAFPTWSMATDGKALLSRLGLEIAFISEYNFALRWSGPVPERAVVVWFDSKTTASTVESRYPIISTLKAKDTVVVDVTNLPASQVLGHILNLPLGEDRDGKSWMGPPR